MVAKMVSKAWKELSEEERNKWIEMGRLDRERYEQEKKEYKGPWKIPDVKNPNAPKKPMSSFLAFSNERRRALAKAHPNLNGTELSCLLAKLWKECPAEIKQKYRERELREREMFKQCRAEWERRQDLAARVALWTEEMPNGQDLCKEFQLFMDDEEEEDETESSCHSVETVSTSAARQQLVEDEQWFVPPESNNNIAISSAMPNVMKICETTMGSDNNRVEGEDGTPETINHFPTSLPITTNQVATTTTGFEESSFGNAMPPSFSSTTADKNTITTVASCCYDHYSMDDILQDDELFEDFSPRDVPSVPKSSTTIAMRNNDNNNTGPVMLLPSAAPWNNVTKELSLQFPSQQQQQRYHNPTTATTTTTTTPVTMNPSPW